MSLRLIKLVALDLDGTLLRSDKSLSPRNLAAIRLAAESGMKIVPATGRYYSMIPECVRKLDFIDYAITINGAAVLDLRNNRNVYSAELPADTAIEVMELMDRYDTVYDCYAKNSGWMGKEHWEKADSYAPDDHYRKLIHDFRTPVDDLKEFVSKSGCGIQKIQFFARDLSVRSKLMDELKEAFPDLCVSSSVRNNAEINAGGANKGDAVSALCEMLGCGADNVLAFGDSSNDISMIKMAGIGVAMGNAGFDVCTVANRVTMTNDEDGVATVLYDLLGI